MQSNCFQKKKMWHRDGGKDWAPSYWEDKMIENRFDVKQQIETWEFYQPLNQIFSGWWDWVFILSDFASKVMAYLHWNKYSSSVILMIINFETFSFLPSKKKGKKWLS